MTAPLRIATLAHEARIGVVNERTSSAKRWPMAAVDLVPPTISFRRIAAVAGGEANWRFRRAP